MTDQAVLTGGLNSILVNGSGVAEESTTVVGKEGKKVVGHHTYPRLLHFFFLQGGRHEQRSTEGKRLDE